MKFSLMALFLGLMMLVNCGPNWITPSDEANLGTSANDGSGGSLPCGCPEHDGEDVTVIVVVNPPSTPDAGTPPKTPNPPVKPPKPTCKPGWGYGDDNHCHLKTCKKGKK